MERRWGKIALTFVEVQIRSGLSVPVELGGGPIGTLDLYAASPRGWDDTEIIASQAYAGIVAKPAPAQGAGQADEQPDRAGRRRSGDH
jgi:hypothetical protein